VTVLHVKYMKMEEKCESCGIM